MTLYAKSNKANVYVNGFLKENSKTDQGSIPQKFDTIDLLLRVDCLSKWDYGYMYPSLH